MDRPRGSRVSSGRRIARVATRRPSGEGPHEQQFADRPHRIFFLPGRLGFFGGSGALLPAIPCLFTRSACTHPRRPSAARLRSPTAPLPVACTTVGSEAAGAESQGRGLHPPVSKSKHSSFDSCHFPPANSVRASFVSDFNYFASFGSVCS